MREYIVTLNNVTILFIVGLTQYENTDLVLMSNPNDLWFHFINEPSAHLVAKTDHLQLNKKLRNKVIKQGMHLLKQHMKKDLDVQWSYIRDLEITDIPGQVLVN